ncbi:MAG: THUMP domain-containing protein [Candidatus Thermoplasmatota archaeon]|nr:THUMP domain-containing protein [Candidatus Thermoplasmatota archaeon]
MYLVRYSEIGLKGHWARASMEKLLVRNLSLSLKAAAIPAKTARMNGRFFVECERCEAAESAILTTFGVKSISWVEDVPFDSLEELLQRSYAYFNDYVRGKRFAIRVRRLGTHSFRSRDVEIQLGNMLNPISAGVDLSSPDTVVSIEIRNSRAYFYMDTLHGPGGLPIGSQGRMLSLISGGIDSPLAAWYLMKRGVMVDFLFVSLADPFDTDITVDQYRRLVAVWGHGYASRLFVVDGTPLIEMAGPDGEWKYSNVTFKKALYRIGEQLAMRLGSMGLITGESIGQVSSQTTENLFALSTSVRIPIYRPLIGMDKDDIVAEARMKDLLPARNLGEFCSFFADRPITRISREELESDVISNDLVESMVSAARTFNKDDAEISEPFADAGIEDLGKELKSGDAMVIDMRSDEKYREWHYPGSINVRLGELESYVSKLERSRALILYCSKGLISARGASLLRRKGYRAMFSDADHVRAFAEKTSQFDK